MIATEEPSVGRGQDGIDWAAGGRGQRTLLESAVAKDDFVQSLNPARNSPRFTGIAAPFQQWYHHGGHKVAP